MKYLHTMVRVQDLTKSLQFYCEALGMKEVRRTENENGRFTLVFLRAHGDSKENHTEHVPCLELTYNWPKDGQPEAYTHGRNFGHVAFAVKNIYKTCQHLEEMGISILRPPRDGYMAFIKSPDNISIELLQEGSALDPIEPWISRPNVGTW